MYFPNGLAGLWQTQGKRLVPAARAQTGSPVAAEAPSRLPTIHP
jgi:urea transport system permease protein